MGDWPRLINTLSVLNVFERQGAEIHAVLISYNVPTEQNVHQKTLLSTGSTEAL